MYLAYACHSLQGALLERGLAEPINGMMLNPMIWQQTFHRLTTDLIIHGKHQQISTSAALTPLKDGRPKFLLLAKQFQTI